MGSKSSPKMIETSNEMTNLRADNFIGLSSNSLTNSQLTRNSEVKTVMLYGVPIIALVMDGRERLCLAQISNTLLKEFSYNEIHNRRVALGITCIQCTPVQLELLRRARAMPVSSRRCGMITKREAERLCKSFLAETKPPKLPDNFAFDVFHQCSWGCKGNFIPSRYNSSRAKCIKCSFCGLFFSPNKFIFHSHRLPDSKYVQPDAANFNSWRRHIKLGGTPPEEVSVVWEDVKAMFNGGSRKRAMAASLNSVSRSSSKVLSEQCTKKSRFETSKREETNSKASSQSLIESSIPKVLTGLNPTFSQMPPLTIKDYSSSNSNNSFTNNLINLSSNANGGNKYIDSLQNQTEFRTSLADLMWSRKQPSWSLPYNCVLWPRPHASPVTAPARLTGHLFNPFSLRDHKTNGTDRLISNNNHWLMPMENPFLLNSTQHQSLVGNNNSNNSHHVSAFKPVNKYKNEKISTNLGGLREEKVNEIESLNHSETDDTDIDIIGTEEEIKSNGITHELVNLSQPDFKKEYEEKIWKQEKETKVGLVLKNKLDKNLPISEQCLNKPWIDVLNHQTNKPTANISALDLTNISSISKSV